MRNMRRNSLLFIFRIIVIAVIVICAAGSERCIAVSETSRTDHPVANGITESTVYVTVDGGYNVRTHILRIAPNAEAVFKASYGDYYSSGMNAAERKRKTSGWGESNWTCKRVSDQAIEYANAADSEGSVIAASNGDFFDVSSGEPEGSLVIEGNTIRKNKKRPFFAVLKTGKAVIRRAGSKLSDVSEAIGGRDILIWNGKVTNESDGLRNPREAIGICKDGTVVIVNVDGREPASAGVTLPELAEILKAQGCKSALNFDGGGSACFLTKRYGEEALQLRSNHSDGSERKVSSALLILGSRSVTDDNADYLGNIVKINDSRTYFRKNSNGLYRYYINGKGQTGFFAVNGESYLFSKGKGVTAKIKIGNVKYNFYKGRLNTCSDKKAGNVILGYCGNSGTTGKNLIYAYHKGDKMLNIGLNPQFTKKNGKMKDWTLKTATDTPWYAVRAEIKHVYIGNGVENIGDYFLYSAKNGMPGGSKPPKCVLNSIRLPSSLKRIGAYSLYNKPLLAGIKVPIGVKSLGKGALLYSGRGTLTFKGKTPPVIGKAALSKTKFRIVCVKHSTAWKRYIRQKKLKKKGYKGKVKYL